MTSEYDSMAALAMMIRDWMYQLPADTPEIGMMVESAQLLLDFVELNHQMAHDMGNGFWNLPTRPGDHFLWAYTTTKGGKWANSIFQRASEIIRKKYGR